MSLHPRARKFITPVEAPWAHMQVAAKRRGRQKRELAGARIPALANCSFPGRMQATNRTRVNRKHFCSKRGGEREAVRRGSRRKNEWCDAQLQ